jgi:hypothetical protein
MAEEEKINLNLETLGGYTQDDPEYWVILAKIVGNPLVEIEDDSEFVSEDGTVKDNQDSQ